MCIIVQCANMIVLYKDVLTVDTKRALFFTSKHIFLMDCLTCLNKLAVKKDLVLFCTDYNSSQHLQE